MKKMSEEEALFRAKMMEKNHRALMRIKDKEIADLKKQLEEEK
jgi:hypothetical protein